MPTHLLSQDTLKSVARTRPQGLVGSPLRRAALRRAGLLGMAAAMVVLSACGESQASPDAVSLEYARAEHESGRAVLIDIREPAEHATGVAAGARLLPMRQLNQRLAEIPANPGQPVLLICNTQNRSSATLGALRERGYAHVRYVNGGMSEWARRGWPLVKPETSKPETNKPETKTPPPTGG